MWKIGIENKKKSNEKKRLKLTVILKTNAYTGTKSKIIK